MKVRNPQEYIEAGVWDSFQATHIFPLAYLELWNQLNFNKYITVPGPGGDNINSVQNGILLRDHMHTLFDTYAFTISPNHGYKIICFHPDVDNIAGTYPDRSFTSNPSRPPDELLNWHFRQAILTNMKGMGEPCFENDFPPGSDMVGQILRGPKAGERMEFELFTRLGHLDRG
ncbi:hypothetical protein VTN77DRAFT_4255 [Rasamsonia byssochlamydoides]|uniref:uncharacterized protein n=1 Tax=Rasamsonia byssochlamydoides TaxID=89139 RepID=UPI0037448F9E